jgi:hypothetical protein
MSRYDELIVSLKNECRKKRVSYRDIIKKLNRFEYDEIINDERIGDIIQDIIAEREDIARIARDIYNNLTFLNELLEIFGEEPQTSLTKARKLFKTKIFINIYDLCYGRYNKRTLKLAKERGFKCFLIGI